jgi:mandelamide amidase
LPRFGIAPQFLAEPRRQWISRPALGPTNNNAAFGPARNPYDPTRIPGGSSGGTGAAVAARLAPAGLGTDTGGSIRVPASLSGVVSLRPTTLRWPQAGIVPISHTRDTAGPSGVWRIAH